MAIKVRRIDFSPDEWIAGTQELTLEEEGLYIRICALIWSRGERITYDLLKRSCNAHGNKLNALIHRLEAAGKIVRNGSEIGQKRAENELENAQKRLGKWLEKGREFRNRKGLASQPLATRVASRAEPSTSKEEGFSPKALNPVFLTAGDATPPPLPSRGDGDAAALPAATTKAEADPPTVFEDPALKADAVAALDRCLDAIRGKLGVLEADAASPPPPDPRLVAFRMRLQRLNALAGERLTGNMRLHAWEIIGRAAELGDPMALSPEVLADLAAIESLAAYAEAAE